MGTDNFYKKFQNKLSTILSWMIIHLKKPKTKWCFRIHVFTTYILISNVHLAVKLYLPWVIVAKYKKVIICTDMTCLAHHMVFELLIRYEISNLRPSHLNTRSLFVRDSINRSIFFRFPIERITKAFKNLLQVLFHRWKFEQNITILFV